MSKAILITDMPKNCGECKLYMNNGNSYWCKATGIDTTGFTITARCPLKPMPERINPLKVDSSNLLDLGYMHGRNDLINEIEGEEE